MRDGAWESVALSVADEFVIVTRCKICGVEERSRKGHLIVEAKKRLQAYLQKPPLHESDEGCFGILEVLGLELGTGLDS